MKLPDLAELIALRGAANGLSLRARRPALAQLQGSYRSAQRGRGMEFEEVRQYVAGDDARSIDWRVTARRGRTHTKLFREERERPVWLVADLHSGLYFGSKLQYKSALLVRAAALLGWVAVLGGDRLGAVIANGKDAPLVFRPRAREAGVLPILQALENAQPSAPGAPDQTGLNRSLTVLRPLLQHGSLVLILSDFNGLDAQTELILAGGTIHSDFRLLWITDPLERTGLPAGTFRLGLPDRIWWLDGNHSRTQWRDTWAQRERRIEAVAHRYRLPLNCLDTGQPMVQTLPALLREPRWAA